MIHFRRLALAALPLACGLATFSPPTGAQQPVSPRFAFADTTLLRDTLDLKFDRLFPLADSLQVLPDSLRAISIRYRLELGRLVFMADSMRVPIDSVGPVLQRERYNPLAATGQRFNTFLYNSGLNLGRRSSTWTNDSNYGFSMGSVFVRNVTVITITRTRDGDLTERLKSRSSDTELGWKFSPNFSVGGRVSLQGNETFKPGSIYNSSESRNQFDFSIRTRQQPSPKLTSQVNFFGGPFDEPNSIPVKRGFSGVLSGQLAYARGKWLNQDLNVQTSGKIGRARLPGRPWLDTQDLSGDVRGNLSLFEESPVRLRVGFRLQKSRFERPDTLTGTGSGSPVVADYIRGSPSSTRSMDVALRFQRRNDQYFGFTERLTGTKSVLAVSREGRFTQDQSSSWDQSFGADGRYTFRGWSLDAGFSNGFPASEQPRRALVQGVYVYVRERQKLHNRSVQATLAKYFTSRMTFRASGGVNLTSTTQVIDGKSDHTSDYYRQNYKLEGLYNRSQRMSTGLVLDVSRTLDINLLASSSASNREDRSYRAEWRWSYRLLRGLTANQQNQLGAIYTYNPFAPDRNRLALDYLTVTTLDAVVTPRLSIKVTHNARVKPSGGYVRAIDQREYFKPSDESRDYTLTGDISYAPSPAIRFSLRPLYLANDRDGTRNGEAAPTSRQRNLSLSGGASLNLPVGTKGQLSGSISRDFHSSRSTQYQNGVARPEPRYEDDFWNGALQLSWQL